MFNILNFRFDAIKSISESGTACPRSRQKCKIVACTYCHSQKTWSLDLHMRLCFSTTLSFFSIMQQIASLCIPCDILCTHKKCSRMSAVSTGRMLAQAQTHRHIHTHAHTHARAPKHPKNRKVQMMQKSVLCDFTTYCACSVHRRSKRKQRLKGPRNRTEWRKTTSRTDGLPFSPKDVLLVMNTPRSQVAIRDTTSLQLITEHTLRNDVTRAFRSLECAINCIVRKEAVLSSTKLHRAGAVRIAPNRCNAGITECSTLRVQCSTLLRCDVACRAPCSKACKFIKRMVLLKQT